MHPVQRLARSSARLCRQAPAAAALFGLSAGPPLRSPAGAGAKAWERGCASAGRTGARQRQKGRARRVQSAELGAPPNWGGETGGLNGP
jgi:hypothetical protein